MEKLVFLPELRIGLLQEFRKELRKLDKGDKGILKYLTARKSARRQGVSNTQKKDTILFLALNLAGKSIFTPPKFFLSAVTQLPYKEILGEEGPKSHRKVFRTMRYVHKSCQKWGSKIFSVFSNLALTFHLRMLSVNGLQNSISQPILHPKRGSCLLLASWIPLARRLSSKSCRGLESHLVKISEGERR